MKSPNRYLRKPEKLVAIDPAYEAFIKDDLYCIVCLDYLFDPQMCANCEAFCCRSCFQNWDRNKQECPGRCDKLDIKEINLTKRKQLTKFIVRCKFGCEVSILSYLNHINECHEINKEDICWNCNKRARTTDIKIKYNPKEELLSYNERIKIFDKQNLDLRTEKDIIVKRSLEESIEQKRIIEELKTKLVNRDYTIQLLNEEYRVREAENLNQMTQQIENLETECLETVRERIKNKFQNFKKNVNLTPGDDTQGEPSRLVGNQTIQKLTPQEDIGQAYKDSLKMCIDLQETLEKTKRNCICKEYRKMNNDQKEMIERLKTEIFDLKNQEDADVVESGKMISSPITFQDLYGLTQQRELVNAHNNSVTSLPVLRTINNKTLLISGGGNCIKIWNTLDWSLVFEIAQAHENAVYSLAIVRTSNNESYLVSGSYMNIKIWRTTDWTLVKECLKIHDNYVLCIPVIKASTKESVLVTGGGMSIKIWNPDDWSLIKEITYAHDNAVYSLALVMKNEESYLVSGSYDKSIKIWNTNNWTIIKEIIDAHEDWVTCLTVVKTTFNETLLVSGGGMNIKIWSTVDWTLIKEIENAHDNVVYSLSAVKTDKNETVLISGSYMQIKLWNMNDWKLVRKIPKAHDNAVYSLAALKTENNETFLVSGSYMNIKIWK